MNKNELRKIGEEFDLVNPDGSIIRYIVVAHTLVQDFFGAPERLAEEVKAIKFTSASVEKHPMFPCVFLSNEMVEHI